MQTIIVIEKRKPQPDGRILCHQFHKTLGAKAVSVNGFKYEFALSLIKTWYETDTDHPFTSLEKL